MGPMGVGCKGLMVGRGTYCWEWLGFGGIGEEVVVRGGRRKTDLLCHGGRESRIAAEALAHRSAGRDLVRFEACWVRGLWSGKKVARRAWGRGSLGHSAGRVLGAGFLVCWWRMDVDHGTRSGVSWMLLVLREEAS